MVSQERQASPMGNVVKIGDKTSSMIHNAINERLRFCFITAFIDESVKLQVGYWILSHKERFFDRYLPVGSRVSRIHMLHLKISSGN